MNIILKYILVTLLLTQCLTDLKGNNPIEQGRIQDTLIIVDTFNLDCENVNFELRISEFNGVTFVTNKKSVNITCDSFITKYSNNAHLKNYFINLKEELSKIKEISVTEKNMNQLKLLVSSLIKEKLVCVFPTKVNIKNLIWESEVKSNTVYERFRTTNGVMIFELIKGHF